ncbi:MAG: nitroreductase family protein [Thermoguttaceae bacterium]|nr:nitroreductase family protein [Thermoguttaceae bacterium]
MVNAITIDAAKCTGCQACMLGCSGRVFEYVDDKAVATDESAQRCIQCGHCVCLCPTGAITLASMGPNDVVQIAKEKLPSTEQFAELVKYRRSVRHYQSRKIDSDSLNRLFEIVRWAPTAKNLLKTKWIVVNNPATVRRLAGLAIDALRETDAASPMVAAWDRGYDWVHRGAPCLILAFTDQESVWTAVDSTIAVETLDLAAATMGLGACWAGLLMRFLEDNQVLRSAFGLVPGNKVGAALMIGYPDGEVYSKAPFRPSCTVRFVED